MWFLPNNISGTSLSICNAPQPQPPDKSGGTVQVETLPVMLNITIDLTQPCYLPYTHTHTHTTCSEVSPLWAPQIFSPISALTLINNNHAIPSKRHICSPGSGTIRSLTETWITRAVWTYTTQPIDYVVEKYIEFIITLLSAYMSAMVFLPPADNGL